MKLPGFSLTGGSGGRRVELAGISLAMTSVAIVQSLGCVRLFAVPWTVACPAPLSMNSPGKNTGVDCHFLLLGIFPTQGSNPHLLLSKWILLPLGHLGSWYLFNCFL